LVEVSWFQVVLLALLESAGLAGSIQADRGARRAAWGRENRINLVGQGCRVLPSIADPNGYEPQGVSRLQALVVLEAICGELAVR